METCDKSSLSMETTILTKDGKDVYKVEYYTENNPKKQTALVPLDLDPLTLSSIKQYVEEKNNVVIVDKPVSAHKDKDKKKEPANDSGDEYTYDELMAMSMTDMRVIGKKYKVYDTSKTELAKEIINAQKEKKSGN